MHNRKLLAALTLMAALLPWQNVSAADLALVLLTDVSSSMGDDEFRLVKEGYRAAFADPEVLAAIAKNPRGVAVAYVEFSDENSVMVVKGWDLLTDGTSALAFGNAVALAPRSSTGNTALSNGIRRAAELLLAGNFEGARLVIDVASDHPGDGGVHEAIGQESCEHADDDEQADQPDEHAAAFEQVSAAAILEGFEQTEDQAERDVHRTDGDGHD